MDRFAEQHNGLAPIVAIADQLSSSFKNPLCSDTENGAVATYLEHDVPAWLEEHFQVDTRPQSWAVGGLSNGGTCAMQVLSRKGGPYRTVLDMSGEEFPNLHNLETTIDKGFGGDKAAFEENNPLSIFSSGRISPGIPHFVPLAIRNLETSSKGSGRSAEPGIAREWTYRSAPILERTNGRCGRSRLTTSFPGSRRK